MRISTAPKAYVGLPFALWLVLCAPCQSDEVAMTPAARTAVDGALAHLASTQDARGAWPSAQFADSTAITSLAGLAFMSDGTLPGRGRYGDNVRRALDYVLMSAQATGLLEYGAPHHAMYSHAFSTLFLAEVWGMAGGDEVRYQLRSAVDLVVRTQNREGGWRYQPRVADADVSVSVCQVVALRAAANAGIAVPRETIDSATGYIKRCARRDGGFSYQAGSGESAFPRSAGALLCLALAGERGDPQLPRSVDYLLRNADYDGRFYFYGHYYAAQAVHLVAPDRWRQWYDGITGRLVSKQAKEGSWQAVGEDKVQCTAMSVLVLTIPNGYLPLYQR